MSLGKWLPWQLLLLLCHKSCLLSAHGQCATHTLKHGHAHKVLLKCILRAARSGGECKLNYNIDAAAQENVREWYNTRSITQVITIIVEIKADQRQKGISKRKKSSSRAS